MRQLILILRTLSLLLLVFTISKCGAGRDYSYTASKKTLLDSIYHNNSAIIDSFFAKLNFITDISGLSTPLMILDSSGDDKKMAAIDLEEEGSTYCDSIGLRKGNFILANSKSNMDFLYGWDKGDIPAEANITYILKKYLSDPNGPAGYILPVTYVPGYWFYHTYHQFQKYYGDSLYEDGKGKFIEKQIKEIRSLDSIKYIIVVKDIVVKMPKLISKQAFETGELISSVKLYEISSQKLLCRHLIYTQNSDKVSHMFLTADGEMLDTLLDSRLMEDFGYQKNKGIIDLFKVKE